MPLKNLWAKVVDLVHVAEPSTPPRAQVRRVVSPVAVQVVQPEIMAEAGVPRYPPLDNGISVASSDEILASQGDLVRLLRRNLGLSDADFERRYLAPIRRAAELINLLPASRDKHHTGAGGLFSYALTLAVRSAQSADGKIFAANESVERRRSVEAGWRHAAFLTGLTCELFRPLTEMLVVDAQGQQWSPFVNSLTDWARLQKVGRVYVRWHQRDDHRAAANAMSTWAVNAVVGNDILGELHSIKPLIVETIFGVASGAITSADNSTMASLINEVRRRVIEKDQAVAPTTYGKLTSGAHLEPYFLDAMRNLLKKGVWQVNTRTSRCQYGADGFFVAWRSGSEEILGYLREHNIQGVPTSAETLADMMGRAGIIAVGNNGGWLHIIRNAATGATFPAIKLQTPSAVLGQQEIKPSAETLRVLDSRAQPAGAVAATNRPLMSVPKIPTVKPTETVDEDGVITQVDTSEKPASKPSTGGTERPAAKREAEPAVDEGTQSATVQPPAAADVPAAPPAPERQGRKGQGQSAAKGATKGAIAPVDEAEEEDESPFDPDMQMALGSPICREIAVWRNRYNKSIAAADFLRTSDGLAISFDLLKDSAIPVQKVVEALQKAGYLHTQVMSGRQRNMLQIPFPKGDRLGIVMLTTYARKAGFILD